MASAALRLEQTEYFDAQGAVALFQRRLADGASNLKLLADEAQRRGFKKVTGPAGDFGFRQKFRAATPIRPPKGQKAEPVQEIEFELVLSAYEDPDSPTQAAVANVRIVAGSNTETYDMLLESEVDDFEDVREYKVEGGKVVRAHSWWTAARDCVLRTCIGPCIGALFTCAGTWAAYLGCVAIKCGGCWVKCAACATCDCRWWCKWAIGCCRN